MDNSYPKMMFASKQIDSVYSNWQDDGGLQSKQLTDHEAIDNGTVQAYSATHRRQVRHGRESRRNHAQSKSSEQNTTTSQKQVPNTAKPPAIATATTPLERQAAATQFWTTATSATLFGFQSCAETLAAHSFDKTRNQSDSESIAYTDYFHEVNRPVEEGESPFDPDMLPARATAILGGFVEKRGDVGMGGKIGLGRGQRWLGEDHVGGSGYDHGEFEDTDAFYVQPVLKLKSFDPEAMVFRPGGWTNGI